MSLFSADNNSRCVFVCVENVGREKTAGYFVNRKNFWRYNYTNVYPHAASNNGLFFTL